MGNCLNQLRPGVNPHFEVYPCDPNTKLLDPEPAWRFSPGLPISLCFEGKQEVEGSRFEFLILGSSEPIRNWLHGFEIDDFVAISQDDYYGSNRFVYPGTTVESPYPALNQPIPLNPALLQTTPPNDTFSSYPLENIEINVKATMAYFTQNSSGFLGCNLANTTTIFLPPVDTTPPISPTFNTSSQVR